jgi:hypothetical protein
MGVCGTSRRLTRRAAFHAQDAGGGRHVPHPINARASAAAIPMAVALLGCRAHLGQPEHHPQPDDGLEGSGLVHREGSSACKPGFLQTGIEPPLGAGLPSARVRPTSVDV